MPSPPRSNRNRIILIVILILCITLVTLYMRESDKGPLHKVQNFFLDLVSPISSGFSKIFRPIKDGFVNLFHLPSLAKKNAELQKEVAKLKTEAVKSKEMQNDIEELKKLLKWTEENPEYETVGADIIGQSPDNWQRLMIVNKGSSQGVKKYMAVVNDAGLVGRIISVGSRSAVVQLVTDSRSGVGGRGQRNRETGIAEGQNKATLKFVPMNDDAVFEVGDIIETSGLGGTCPAGVPIGRVSQVKKRTKGLARLVEVEPYVDFSRLDKVVIIVTPEPESIILQETQ